MWPGGEEGLAGQFRQLERCFVAFGPAPRWRFVEMCPDTSQVNFAQSVADVVVGRIVLIPVEASFSINFGYNLVELVLREGEDPPVRPCLDVRAFNDRTNFNAGARSLQALLRFGSSSKNIFVVDISPLMALVRVADPRPASGCFVEIPPVFGWAFGSLLPKKIFQIEEGAMEVREALGEHVERGGDLLIRRSAAAGHCSAKGNGMDGQAGQDGSGGHDPCRQRQPAGLELFSEIDGLARDREHFAFDAKRGLIEAEG